MDKERDGEAEDIADYNQDLAWRHIMASVEWLCTVEDHAKPCSTLVLGNFGYRGFCSASINDLILQICGFPWHERGAREIGTQAGLMEDTKVGMYANPWTPNLPLLLPTCSSFWTPKNHQNLAP